jgi:hypothetical protein
MRHACPELLVPCLNRPSIYSCAWHHNRIPVKQTSPLHGLSQRELLGKGACHCSMWMVLNALICDRPKLKRGFRLWGSQVQTTTVTMPRVRNQPATMKSRMGRTRKERRGGHHRRTRRYWHGGRADASAICMHLQRPMGAR